MNANVPTTTLAGAPGSIPEALPQDYRLIPESSLGDSMYQGKPPRPMFGRRPGSQVSEERRSMSLLGEDVSVMMLTPLFFQ